MEALCSEVASVVIQENFTILYTFQGSNLEGWSFRRFESLIS
jgi:hypothetical protein